MLLTHGGRMHMDDELKRRTLAYYDERAPEYELAYTAGTGTASALSPSVFQTEARALQRVAARCLGGHVLDLACGTAYWLPSYAAKAVHVTLFDQSAGMLDEARRKAARLGVLDRCTFTRGDVFEHAFEEGGYDTVLLGFLVSHVTPDDEPAIFDLCRRVVRPGGRMLLFDSAWSPERRAVNAKVERQIRRLESGQTFEVYKRYCDRDDIVRWEHLIGLPLQVEHDGQAFLAVSGRVPGHGE